MKARTYSNNLRKLRIKSKKSRLEVANAVGVSVSSIAMYEQGERVPRDDTKVKLAKYFNTTVSAIFFAT